MMELRRFYMEDYKDLNTWYHERKGESFPLKHLSNTGFIVPGVAVGFIIKTDANLGILEPFISNPHAPKDMRDEALNLILKKLTEEAAEMEYSLVLGFSTSQVMLERSYKQGFEIHELNSTTVIKRIQ